MRLLKTWMRLFSLILMLLFSAACLEVEIDSEVLENRNDIPHAIRGEWEHEYIKIDVDVTDRKAVTARVESKGEKSIFVGFILEIEDGAYAFLYEECSPMIHNSRDVKLLCYIVLSEDTFELFFPDEAMASRLKNVARRFPFATIVNNEVETIGKIWKEDILRDERFLFRRVKGSQYGRE